MLIIKREIIITLFALVSLAAPKVVAFRNNWHSVLQCDTVSSEKDCSRHCEQTYIIVGLDMIRKNKNLYESIWRDKTSLVGGQAQCCCAFNTKLPNWMLDMKLINRSSNRNSGSRGFGVCLPIGLSIMLSSRTIESYAKLCSLLKVEVPLTMLELRQFVRFAAYLNYMKPKHPSVLATLKLKEVSRISDLKMIDQFEQVLFESLLDKKGDSHAEGQNNRLEQLEQSQRLLRELLKSDVVSRAFDELVLNNVLLDITKTRTEFKQLDESVLRVPAELQRGEYDKYDTSARGHYFRVENIDCSELRSASARLRKYLATVKRLLAKLDEKLLFEHMSTNFNQLSELLEAAHLYKNLIEVNCLSAAAQRVSTGSLFLSQRRYQPEVGSNCRHGDGGVTSAVCSHT